jgi:hypothetical protein
LNTQEKNPQLQLSLNIDHWLPKDLDITTEQGMVKNMKPETKYLPIRFEAPSFFVESTETLFGSPVSSPILQQAVQSALVQRGMKIASSRKDASYIISVQGDVSPGQQAQGFFVAFLNLSTTVRHTKTETVVYQDNQAQLKGVQLNQDAAGQDAFKKGKDKIESQIVPAMLESIL